MTDLTPESPAVRLYAANLQLTPYGALGRITTNRTCQFTAERLAAEHEKIVTERLAAVVAERDAAIAERDRLREALEVPTRQMWAAAGDALVNDKKLKLKAHHDHCATLVWNAMSRAALNTEAKP
ncbi:MAG TPA: hypothetical protein PK677_11225 [Acidiphilium sp.]|nr:hypothetical protein [Acidiphilium sp.]